MVHHAVAGGQRTRGVIFFFFTSGSGAEQAAQHCSIVRGFGFSLVLVVESMSTNTPASLTVSTNRDEGLGSWPARCGLDWGLEMHGHEHSPHPGMMHPCTCITECNYSNRWLNNI